MKKEELLALGLTEEQATKILAEFEKFVPKNKYEEALEENKKIKASVTERDKQLEELKKAGEGNTALQKQIEALQKQNAEQVKVHEAEMKKLKLDNAIELALSVSGARNTKAVKSLLNSEKLKLGEDGKVTGLDEQINAIKTSDSYMFKDSKQTEFKGLQPGASGVENPSALTPDKMSYDQLCAYMEANPDAKL